MTRFKWPLVITGSSMSTSSESGSGPFSWLFFGRRILWRCAACERVRSPGEYEREEAWVDTMTWMTAHALTTSDLWFLETYCDRCAFSRDAGD